MHWHKVDFPEPAKQAIIAEGGKPLEAWHYINAQTDTAMLAMVSLDPSGPNGELEKHASVSVLEKGVHRKPGHFEMADALNCLRIDPRHCLFFQGNNALHAFERHTGAVESD